MENKKALTQWEKSDISYYNYLLFIDRKTNKFKLSILDLFYLKNFKGGFATFDEPEKDINNKLKKYSILLNEINDVFQKNELQKLNSKQVNELIEFANKGFMLVEPKSKTKIDGFGFSFMTTLLHFHFPKLYPILDRRVLSGLNLINKEKDLYKNDQVKSIQNFYPKLIREFKEKLGNKTMRELDKELFIMEIY